jgi:hypothetical protein
MGVQITSGRSNKVIGNYIGTTKSGTANLGNGNSGVIVSSQGANNTIGGDGAARNTIAFNGDEGVQIGVSIFEADVTGNTVFANSIFSNEGLGIDLGDDGGTTNDVGDLDSGPNNLQNYPVLTSAKTGRRTTTIRGTLESTPNGSFTIWFFSNPKNTKEEGKKFIGHENVTDSDGDGIMPFTFKPTKKVKAGLFVTATVTNDGGDTSECSKAVVVS